MKTILVFSVLAALSAFVLLVPFSFEVGVSLLFITGLVAMFIADYARVLRPSPVGRATDALRLERFQLAA